MVEAGSIRIAALGTQSSADLQAGDVEVWVAEHSARVEPVAGPAAPVVLAEGVGVDARPHAIPAPVPYRPPCRATCTSPMPGVRANWSSTTGPLPKWWPRCTAIATAACCS
ncbi:hypothetical protein ESD82_08970 (plasmid) [Paracoccus pantotrophus]|uniref:Uncharacterized protein n=1 Tax=Paracoccus pantotrophus TaxID=82367 RepID=A0AAE6NTV0_PARPN|nr:hypothetical protein [Paracoccus pantotrophus]QFG36336.1 hypothetical protein ESD82_08970 [Paracoccus pantotrophus]